MNPKINRQKFFKLLRVTLFHGKLSTPQVEGIDAILDYWEKYTTNWDLRWLAYMLATVYWETARTMQPISEMGSQKYLRTKKYWPYIGRGFVQLTWKDNYEKMSVALNGKGRRVVDLVANPDQALEMKNALFIMFEGMTDGLTEKPDFTKYGLKNFFNSTTHEPRDARRIINGVDKAAEIEDIYNQFASAILMAVSESGSSQESSQTVD